MNAKDEAWANLDRQLGFAWDGSTAGGAAAIKGIHETVESIAAAAVAEARAPLVEALKEAHAGLVAILTIPSASAAYDDAIAAAKDGRAAAAAALAKETGHAGRGDR